MLFRLLSFFSFCNSLLFVSKEEKTRKKKKDKLEEEEYSLNSNGYDSNETPRKRGKHF